jgi:dipeptide/tripeptide permease
MFAFQATVECFAATTAYELAYEFSPVFLRGGVLSLFLASIAASSILGENSKYLDKRSLFS